MRLLPLMLLTAFASDVAVAEEIKTYKWKEGNTTYYSDTKPSGRNYEERTLTDEANVVPTEGAPVVTRGAEPAARGDRSQIRGTPLDDEGAAAVAEQESQQGETTPNPAADIGADPAASANPGVSASPAASGAAASSATPAATAPVAPAPLPPPPVVGP